MYPPQAFLLAIFFFLMHCSGESSKALSVASACREKTKRSSCAKQLLSLSLLSMFECLSFKFTFSFQFSIFPACRALFFFFTPLLDVVVAVPSALFHTRYKTHTKLSSLIIFLFNFWYYCYLKKKRKRKGRKRVEAGFVGAHVAFLRH